MPYLSSDPHSSMPQEQHPSKGLSRPTFKRLLVVDDNEDIHLMLGDRLEAMGYLVERAHHGAEALKILAEIPVVGVLLDLEMPVMDGLTFLRELQHRHDSVPIIVMSAEKNQENFLKALQLGAMDYLRKPIDTRLLTQKCVRLFE